MQQQLREVKAKGWQFLYSDRSITDNEHSVVFINKNFYGNAEDIVTALAHELGHIFHPTKSRRDVFNGEAYATINNIKIINDINKTGCYKIGVTAGKKTAVLYSQAYGKMLKTGNIQQALKTIGHVYKCYETTNMGISYAEYYHVDTSDCKR
ncbi:hypothetical protein [Commensalibacter communis]|uniref:hypothetical protein n=1 Tax=Commensalibacter communis TaxID=2972786 RepID=UPI00232FAFBD|nr:hypothetical protein [Commensalibacter communis]